MIQQVSKQYDDYRDSGVDWLGEIPEEWKIMRLKDVIARLESGVSVNASDEPAEGNNIGVLKTSCVGKDTFQYSQNKTVWPTEVDRVCVPVRAGRIIISRMNTPELVGASSYITKDYPNLFLPDRLWQTVFYRNKKLNSKWLSFLIGCKNFRFVLSTVATGTSPSMKNLGQEKFLSIGFPYPSLSEQNAIADYLNEKTAKIDQQINLLTQKAKHYGGLKQALINETVTRGLDKSVPMKDSGIEWIGEIPAHWEIKRAKDIFEKKSRPCLDNDEIVTAFRDGQVTLRLNRRVAGFTNAIKEHGYQRIHAGDLVIHAMDAFAGAIGVSESTGKSSPVYSAYTAINKNEVYVLYYGKLIRQMALSGFISSLGKGIRERSTEFRHKEFFPLQLVIPPFHEQKAIADYLDDKTAQIDAIVEAINAQIEKLKELRKTLINDVVTGKICIL